MPATKISAMPSVSSLLGSEVFPVVQFGTNKKSTILDIVNYFPLSGIGSTGLLTSTDWNTFNNKQSSLTIGNLSETGSSILTITGGTGAIIGSGLTIQVKQATASQNGFLSSTDWNTFNSKGNGTVTSVDLITGTTGTDVNVSGSPIISSGSITLNIPDASATARGLITTGTQTLAGSKILSSAPTFSTMTAGSVLFAGTSGLLSQDNTNLFFDNTNKRLGIGTSSPTSRFHISGSTTASSGTAIGSLFNQTLVAAANNDTLIGLDINPTYTIGAFTGVSNLGLRIQNAFSFGYNSGGSAEIKSLATNGAVDFLGASNNAGSFNIYGGNAYNTGSGIIVRGNSHPSGASIVFVRNNFTQSAIFTTNGNLILGTSTTDSGFKLDISGTCRLAGNTTFTDASNLIIGTSTGTKIGTATSQKIGFWNATPIVQPTTAVGSATYASPGAGSTIKTDDTFDGYTLQQVVKALRNTGILA